MARGEEYKSQDGVFIDQDRNFGKNLQTPGALPTRRRVGGAPGTDMVPVNFELTFVILWVSMVYLL